MNKSIILGSINIVQKLAEQLELLKKVIKDKLILLKGDLMMVQK